MDAEEERQTENEAVEAEAEGAEGQEEQEEEYEDEDDQGEDDEDGDDDIFKNNHDLIGVQGILREQKSEINKIKVS